MKWKSLTHFDLKKFHLLSKLGKLGSSAGKSPPCSPWRSWWNQEGLLPTKFFALSSIDRISTSFRNVLPMFWRLCLWVSGAISQLRPFADKISWMPTCCFLRWNRKGPKNRRKCQKLPLLCHHYFSNNLDNFSGNGKCGKKHLKWGMIALPFFKMVCDVYFLKVNQIHFTNRFRDRVFR